jgi:hypothetical protein
MDCRTALEILDCVEISDRGPIGTPDRSDGDLAAAEAHLATCSRCARIAANRRQLDRQIRQTVRAVKLPRGGRERLLAQLAALETPIENAEVPVDGRLQPAISQAPAENADRAVTPEKQPRRRLWRGTVPVAACLVVAAVGFFSVVWLLTPRWSVDDVRVELAKINFDSFDSLRDYTGEAMASHIPSDPGWQKLEWRARQTAKGLPETSNPHQFAVFGFVIPSRQRRAINGLLAVVPRHRMRGAPAARSLSDALSAASSIDYLSARIGEAVSVAWTDGDVVYVCLVEGGADSLDNLKQILGGPAA